MLKSISYQKGFSIIESMVGLTLGLVVVTGGLSLMSSLMSSNRDVMRETKLIQDLRASADLVARDIRRAGYWGEAYNGVYTPGTTVALPHNPYQDLIASHCESPLPTTVIMPSSTLSSICYYIEQNTPDSTKSNSELFGFRLESGVLYAYVAGQTPRQLSNPDNFVISQFNLIPTSLEIDLSANCPATAGTGPKITVRGFEIELRGYPPSDSNLTRAVRTRVRIRNDAVTGACP